MKVEIRSARSPDEVRVLGVVGLQEGRAVPDEGARRILDRLRVRKPGGLSRRLTYEDGFEYLHALQFTLRAVPYCWATGPLPEEGDRPAVVDPDATEEQLQQVQGDLRGGTPPTE